MYWVFGIFVLIIVGIYFLNKRNPGTTNIASRYYALKNIFGKDKEIAENQYLEMSGVFSQIVYIRNSKMTIDEIKEQAKIAVENEEYGIKYSNEMALVRFCLGINEIIYKIEGLNPMEANLKVIKESDSHEKTINKIRIKGYSKLLFNSTYNYLIQFPECLSGIYLGL